MNTKVIVSFLLLFFAFSYALSQQEYRTVYSESEGNAVNIPLGKISFADEVVEFKLGHPRPQSKFRDSSQALHEPNYTSIKSPEFVSLGCGGQLTLKFVDNGFMNLPGDDLYIFEVGPAKEPARIEVSTNGEDWIYAGDIGGGKSSIDLSEENIDKHIIFYYVRITDLKSVCNSITAGADIDAVAAINSIIELNLEADVLFDVASFNLRSTASKILDSISKGVKQIPKASILIQGHTDNVGSHEYNMKLSKNRSIEVKNELKRILGEDNTYDYEIAYFGKTKPNKPNDSEENRQLNRRVEIRIYPPKDYYESLRID